MRERQAEREVPPSVPRETGAHMHTTAEPRPEACLLPGLHLVRDPGHAGKHGTGPGSLETETQALEVSLSQQAATMWSGWLWTVTPALW